MGIYNRNWELIKRWGIESKQINTLAQMKSNINRLAVPVEVATIANMSKQGLTGEVKVVKKFLPVCKPSYINMIHEIPLRKTIIML